MTLFLHPGDDNRTPLVVKPENNMISLRNVTKSYVQGRTVQVTAVRGVDLDMRSGEFVVITGRSGSGKTTLLNLAGGLTRPSTGEVLIDGINFWSLPDREQSQLRHRKIGFVFQFPSLLPSLTVLENVALPSMFGAKAGQTEARDRAMQLLSELGVSEKQDAYPRQLSAGQHKRVVIARSLVNRPELLLADEPTSDLDERTEKEFMEVLSRIHGAGGVTVVLVTHNRDLIAYGTRALEMADGQIRSEPRNQ